MWFLRLLFALALLCLLVLVSVPIGLYTIPGLDPWLALGLAVGAGVVLAIVVRVLLMAAFTSFLLTALLIAAIAITSQFVFLELEKSLWAGESEILHQLFNPEIETQYLESLGIEPDPKPFFNWLNHTQYQAESGLASQQLKPNEVGAPIDAQTPQDVWMGWFSQLMMFACSLFSAAWFARKRD
jgi:hypothetical protein